MAPTSQKGKIPKARGAPKPDPPIRFPWKNETLETVAPTTRSSRQQLKAVLMARAPPGQEKAKQQGPSQVNRPPINQLGLTGTSMGPPQSNSSLASREEEIIRTGDARFRFIMEQIDNDFNAIADQRKGESDEDYDARLLEMISDLEKPNNRYRAIIDEAIRKREEEEKDLVDVRYRLRAQQIEEDYERRQHVIDEEYKEELRLLLTGMLADIDDEVLRVMGDYEMLDIQGAAGPAFNIPKKSLRRRDKDVPANEPVAKRKTNNKNQHTMAISCLLTDEQIAEDLKIICPDSADDVQFSLYRASIENGKLNYEGKFYSVGSALHIFVEGDDFPGTLLSVNGHYVQLKSAIRGDIRIVAASMQDFATGKVRIDKPKNIK